MLTTLTVLDYSKGKKKYNFFKRDKTHLEVVEYNNIQLVNITYYKYRDRIKWHKIKELAGNEGRCILCSKDIVFPPESGLKRYTTNLLKERITENTALEVIKRCKAPTENIRIGLYDPQGEKSGIIRELLKYTGQVTVVTNATKDYYKIYKDIMRDTGAIIILKNNVKAFKDCHIIIAPKRISVTLPVSDKAVVFTSEKPAVCQSGIVYSSYIVALNESYKEIKPHSLSDEYFAQALYDKGRQHRLGSLLPILCVSDIGNDTIEGISNFVGQYAKLCAE